MIVLQLQLLAFLLCRDVMSITLLNSLTSILAGFAIFSILGYIAMNQGKEVEDVVTDGALKAHIWPMMILFSEFHFERLFHFHSKRCPFEITRLRLYNLITGPGLVFIVYPEALVKMPVSQLFAVLFFFMLLCLAIDSQVSFAVLFVASHTFEKKISFSLCPFTVLWLRFWFVNSLHLWKLSWRPWKTTSEDPCTDCSKEKNCWCWSCVLSHISWAFQTLPT